MRLDAFAGDAGADDLGEPVDVERLQAEQRLDLDAHRLGPRLGAEDARSQPQLAEVDALLDQNFAEPRGVGGRTAQHLGAEVAEEQDLPGALARRDGDDGAAHELRAAVEPETTGEQPVAIGDVDDRARAGAGAAERTRADLRPQRQVGTRVADQRRPPAGARGAVHPDDLVSRDRQHAPWITVPEVPLGRERKRGQVVQRDRRAGLDPRLAQALTVERMIEQARHQRTEPLALERGPFVRRHCLRPLVPHRGHGTSRVASRWIVSVQAPGEDDACRIEALGLSIEVWKTKFPRSTPATWPSHAGHPFQAANRRPGAIPHHWSPGGDWHFACLRNLPEYWRSEALTRSVNPPSPASPLGPIAALGQPARRRARPGRTRLATAYCPGKSCP